MKTLKYYIVAFVVSAFALSSCELFNDKPIDKITQNTIWGSPSLMDAYLLPLYRNMHTGNNTLIQTGFLKNLSKNYLVWFTDQLSVGYSQAYTGSTYGDILKGNVTALYNFSSRESLNCYNNIGSINLLLDSKNEIENPNKERIIGEAHFLRGWYYYKLWRNNGGVMLLDKEVNPLIDAKKYPRASFEEMVNFIVSDANEAESRLEGTYGSEHVGRARKGAAIMLKAKVYYWAAAARFQNADKPYLGFPNDRSREFLEKCAAAYEELFKLSDHALVEIAGATREEIVQGYRDIFLAKHGKESVLEYNHNNEGTGDGSLNFSNIDIMAGTPVDGSTRCLFNPTQNHVDEYRMNNGLRINDANSNYNDQNPYEARDVRFYANVLYDGAQYRKRTIDIRSRWAEGDNKFVPGKDMAPTSSSNGVSNTGYYMAKLTNEKFSFESGTYSTQNSIIWRLAEAYLDYAHVEFLLGNQDVALSYVNQIRARVKEGPLLTITLEDLMNERKVEMAFEEITYWDVIRNGEAPKIMSGSTNPLYKVRIEERDGDVTYYYDVVNGDDDQARYYDKRQLFLPLNWDDIRYHAIEQNPDWIE